MNNQNNYSYRQVQQKINKLNSKKEKRANRFLLFLKQILLIIIIGCLCITGSTIKGAYDEIIVDAPELQDIDVTPKGFSTFIYNAQGNQIAKLVSQDSNRIPVNYNQIPDNLKNAFVAIEDERFWQHNGIDYESIGRAIVVAFKTKNFSQGASTITQQLIKNTIFPSFTTESQEGKVKRKLQEQYLALELEKQMSKKDILLNYMNVINLGHGTLGVQAASKRYFGKDVSELDLAECAAIAGITQNPTRYDPILNPEENNEKKQVVLDKMFEQGYITQKECEKAKKEDIYKEMQEENTADKNAQTVNSWFTDAVIRQVIEDLENKGYSQQKAYSLVYSGGLKIYTTQDEEVQKICDSVVNDDSLYPEGIQYTIDFYMSVTKKDGTKKQYGNASFISWSKKKGTATSEMFATKEDAEKAVKRFELGVKNAESTIEEEQVYYIPQPQVSVVIEDQYTGNVLAISGGRGEKTGNLTWNRATDTLRQPGSTFKIVGVYAAALDAGHKTLASTEKDEPYSYPDGKKVNNWWGNYYRGYQSIRDGIRESMNIVAVKNLADITPELGVSYLKRLGITTLADDDVINGKSYSDTQLPMALGGITYGVKNIELNGAYATIANGGVYIKPRLYTKVTDHSGNVILNTETEEKARAIRRATAWLLTSAMEDVVQEPSGTATSVKFSDMPIAGKTGTTTSNTDEWFCGYTPYYTMSVWSGYDNNQALSKKQLEISKTLWKNIMQKLCEGKKVVDFVKPDSIITMQVCKESGLLPTAGCPIKTEYFDVKNVPDHECTMPHAQTNQHHVQQATATEPQNNVNQTDITKLRAGKPTGLTVE